MIYTYLCDNCLTQYDCEQSMRDPAESTCTNCHKVSTHRVITGGSGFILKGSCWERDNYSTQLRHEIKNLPEDDSDD